MSDEPNPDAAAEREFDDAMRAAAKLLKSSPGDGLTTAKIDAFEAAANAAWDAFQNAMGKRQPNWEGIKAAEQAMKNRKPSPLLQSVAPGAPQWQLSQIVAEVGAYESMVRIMPKEHLELFVKSRIQAIKVIIPNASDSDILSLFEAGVKNLWLH